MQKDKELIVQLYSQASNEIIYWNQMANEKGFEISKQLLGAAVIAIPLIGTFVATSTHLFPGAGYLLAFALFFLFASILAGLQQLDNAGSFFYGYVIYNSNRAKALLDSRDKTLDEALKKADEANSHKPSATASSPYLIIQSWCLGLGLAVTAGIIVATVFIK